MSRLHRLLAETDPLTGLANRRRRVLTDLAGGAAASLAAITATPLGLWLVRTDYSAYLVPRFGPGRRIGPVLHVAVN